MHRISVIIPAYNRAAMVKEAVATVMRQSRPADEIIVVDDGSTDGTGEEALRRGGVVLIRQPNRGVSAARNAGIKRSSGDLIAFLDSDDLWREDKLLLQERFMRAHPEIPLCHTEEEWLKKGKRVNPKRYHRKEGGFIFLRSLERCLVSPSAAMIRRDLLPIVGLFDESMTVCEDYDLWLRITARYPVGFLEAPLTVKRGGHDDQLSKRYPVMDAFRLKALEKILYMKVLPERERAAAFAEFERKAGIVAGGYEKRGKKDEAIALLLRTERLRKKIIEEPGSAGIRREKGKRL